MSNEYQFAGHLVYADFYQCANPERLNDLEFMTGVVKDAGKNTGMTVLEVYTYRFQPQGLDLFVVLAESSIVIHTYPEHGSCFIDIFTCGLDKTPIKALYEFKKWLKPKRFDMEAIPRGEFRNG